MGCSESTIAERMKYISKDSSKSFQHRDTKLSLTERDSYEREDDQGGLGLLSKSNIDILEAQRLRSTDITRKLEDRWMHTHFPDVEPLRRSGIRSKRRQLSCSSNTNIAGMNKISEKDDKPTISVYDCSKADIIHSFTILHFNDVYEILERPNDPIGGAARFAELLRKKMSEEMKKNGERPIVLFSGDCLNPSILSCATQGSHMIEVFNYLGVDIAVFGNHDFDFGVEHAYKCCTKGMESIWLLGNVEDKFTKTNLAEAKSYHIVTRNSGLKIGFIGLVEEEWLDTLATIKKEDIIYTDFVEQARILAAELTKQEVSFIIALTHMRWPNDIRLAREVPEIDLIFGGHDHDYGVKDIDECLIIKSGSDFRNFSSLELFVARNGSIDAKISRYDIQRKVPIDKEMNEIVQRYMKLLEHSLDTCIGTIGIELNGKYEVLRTQEACLGNFIADIVAATTKTDVVLINSGSFRSDGIHQKGDFRLNDLMTILPIVDTVVTMQITGEQLLEAFENGVSKYPKQEGRFPQISGASFGFDPGAPPGERVIRETVRVGGKLLNLYQSYHLATKAYIARGKDGYTSLGKCKLLNDPDASPLLSTVVRNHLANVQRVINFGKEMNCKVSISPDGRNVVCDRSGTNISQAFSLEKPYESILEMESQSIDAKCKNLGHLPRFIAIDAEFDKDVDGRDEIEEKIYQMRKAVRNGNPENATLLKQRAETPDDVRWQITPLLEGRIFHCSDFNS